NDLVLGDSGTANFDPTTGILTSILSTFAGTPVGGTPDTGTSSNDMIVLGSANGTGAGNDVVFGGSGADNITVYSTGNNLVLGDAGKAQSTATGVIMDVFSTNAGDGGNDTIVIGIVNSTTTGKNMVFGGSAADNITVYGNGNNVILGDDGEA